MAKVVTKDTLWVELADGNIHVFPLVDPKPRPGWTTYELTWVWLYTILASLFIGYLIGVSDSEAVLSKLDDGTAPIIIRPFNTPNFPDIYHLPGKES